MSNIFNTHPLALLYQGLRAYSARSAVSPSAMRSMDDYEKEVAYVIDKTRATWGRGVAESLPVKTESPRKDVVEFKLTGFAFTEEQLQELLRRAYRLGQQNPHLES